MKKNKETYLKAFFGGLVILLVLSFYKDVKTAAPTPADLRNRVVGARMMEDGLSPYFFIWKKGDNIRYFDPAIHSYDSVSKSTATPFFHLAFGLVADCPQFQLNTLWMVLEYLILALCCCFAIFSFPKLYRKKAIPLIAFIAITFTYTLGWRMHVYEGQNYLFIPLCIWGSFYFIKRKFDISNAIFFSVFATSLILVRPIAALVFVPFLFNIKYYLKWALCCIVMLIAYCLFVFNSTIQQKNWSDYFKSVQLHAKQHQLNWFSKSNNAVAKYSVDNDNNPVKFFEGIDLNPGLDNLDTRQFEPGNLFIFFDKIFGQQLSIQTMEIVGIITCLAIFLPLFLIKKICNADLCAEILMLLGFCMYDIFSFCQPIGRGQYAWVEFLFPLLLLPMITKKVYLIPICTIIIGVILNIFMFHFIKMRHSVGEFMILISLLFFIYRPLLISYLPKKKWKINDGLYWL